MIALETFQLSKEFSRGKIKALSEVSLSVEQGIIFGLLGPNGAGKTTLVKILLGILFPTSGSANIFGQPINTTSVKEKIGYLPEDHRYPDFLNGGDVLDYYARLSGMSKSAIEENKAKLMKTVDMEQWQQTKLKKYSKGMLQRLGLAQAMMNDPQILFLDEPTDGVDPIGRKKIRDVLLGLKTEGKTIFLNSHLLSEVEMICDQVAILDRGRLIRTGSVAELTSSSKSYRFETSDIAGDLFDQLHSFALQIDKQNGFIQVTVESQQKLNAIIDHLRKNQIDIKSVIPHRLSLEESFMEILKKDLPQ